MARPIHELVQCLAAPTSRAAEAARIAAELGAEAFLVLLYDEPVDALVPAPGFPQTLPGGPEWRSFLKGPHSVGSFEIELPFPRKGEFKLARVLVRDDAVFMLIGGSPYINVEALGEVHLLAAILRSEAKHKADAGLVRTARQAAARATELAAALDRARGDVRRKADELAQALQDSDLLNKQLKELNETLEQRIVERTRERNMLANIIETTDVLVMACDVSYEILAINQACACELERVYGIHAAPGKNLLSLLDDQPEHQQQVRKAWSAALSGEERTFIEDFGDRTHGRTHYEIKCRCLRDERGKRIGAYQFVTDVTERLRRETQLAEAQEALRQSQKMEAIGQLTGGVAHDFNNLLTPIVGALDMLQRKGVGSERDQRLIAGAAQSAERAKTLVQRLLAFARRQPLQPTSVNIVKLVTGMADLIRSTSGPQINVVLDVRDDLPPAKADPNQIEMALLNLSVNARDAMSQGGTLRITAGHEYVGSEHPTKLQPGSYIRLSVADTGIGMDEATRARAVEPFFSTKGLGKGTGLGLSMAHGLASQLGGCLTIQSRQGVGTNVELWLPVSEHVVAAREDIIEPEQSSAASGKALLVDDEELVRRSTAEMLSDLGYQVIEAETAQKALSLITAGLRPDLLVTDHLMPGIDGTDLARRVQSEHPRVQILIISGYAESEGIAPDLPRLTKPFRSDELQTALAGLRS